jgi:DNA-binding MarR family transcriptional regulator
MPLPRKKPPTKTSDLLIGALVRVPTEAIFRRIIRDLNAAGFEGLTLAHLAVLRYPGPDGERPSVLAGRAGITKQAMNRLLGSLEDLGYLKRTDASGQSRGRIVRFTRRGHAAWAKIVEILYEIEREWSAKLGTKDFVHLKQLLGRVWDGLQSD